MRRDSTALSGWFRDCPVHHATNREPECDSCREARQRQDEEARAIGYAILGISPERARELAELEEREACRD